MDGGKEPEGSGQSISFDEARERLRARGYLDRGVEGAVLKGALAARTRALGLLRAAGLAALILAAALAAAESASVTVFSALPLRDALVLFLWLLVGTLALASALVLALVGVTWLRTRGRRDAEGISTEVGVAFGLLSGIAGTLAAQPALEAAGPVAAAGLLVAVGAVVLVTIRVARGLALTVLLASGRAFLARRSRAGAVVATLAGVSALAALTLYLTRRPATEEPLVVKANDRRIVIVGLDGWSDGYLGEERRTPPDGPVLAYRKADTDPAAFWTTVATGETSRRHGIGALELVRIVGLTSPVRPVGASRWYLSRVLPAVGLGRRESVTSAARRVPALWEVARRAGIASLVVNWWTTYPAGEGGGTVLSNHLFFAARAGASLAGEGWPEEAGRVASGLLRGGAGGLRAPGSVERLVQDATAWDDFAARAFQQAREREKPRLALLYLPGLDILGAALAEPERSTEDRVRLAEALQAEARRLRDLVDGPAFREEVDLLVVLEDRGRRETEGRIRLVGPLAKSGVAGSIDVVDLAPTLLAALGVPSSRETAGRVRVDLLVPGAVTGQTVASWGRKRHSREPPVNAREYVENLRSLGYLR